VEGIVEGFAPAGSARECAPPGGVWPSRDRLWQGGNKLSKICCCRCAFGAMRGLKNYCYSSRSFPIRIGDIACRLAWWAAILPPPSDVDGDLQDPDVIPEAGNALLITPHPRAKACACETAAVITGKRLKASRRTGYPCPVHPTTRLSRPLMSVDEAASPGVILSTGGSESCQPLIRAEKAADGVMAGQCAGPAGQSADVEEAVGTKCLFAGTHRSKSNDLPCTILSDRLCHVGPTWSPAEPAHCPPYP